MLVFYWLYFFLHLFFLLFLLFLTFFNIFFLILLVFVLVVFFDFSGHESGFWDGEIDDNGSSFVLALIEFFDGFFAISIVFELYKSKPFIALLIVGVNGYF